MKTLLFASPYRSPVPCPSAGQRGNALGARLAARKARDFREADRLRDELAEAGVILEDRPDGTTLWRRK